MADPMTNFYQGASLGVMPQVRMSEDLGRSFTPIQNDNNQAFVTLKRMDD